jgi:stage II sporulation protein R
LFLWQKFEKGKQFMKYVCGIFSIILILCSVFFLKCKDDKSQDCIRLHVVANSSKAEDQNIKYMIKDLVVEFLNGQLEDAQNVDTAKSKVLNLTSQIKWLVDLALIENGFSYQCKVKVVQEDFPLRSYGDKVFSSGKYQSLRIDLGQAKGDNWWCVVYPMVCYVPSENFADCEYISKIWEMIKSVT